MMKNNNLNDVAGSEAVIIEVADDEIQYINGVSKSTGKPYSFKIQAAYFHTGTKYPQLFEMMLNEDEPNYPAGTYTIARQSFKVINNKLSFHLKLIPVNS